MTQRKIDRVETQSAHPMDERLEQLKQLYPEAVTEDGIDFDALRNLLGIEFPQKERYQFTWAGKQAAILSLQKGSKGTLKPVPEESVNWDSTGHLFIEGDNLEVLKLLYKSYFGRVKMIYIDPPYNTGHEFIYPDDYSEPLQTYLSLTGQLDEKGNARTTDIEVTGRKHSSWLNMIYPRLFIARQLMRDDGVIFVTIDDNEVHNLRLLMNQIFGEENFLACVVWQHSIQPKGYTGTFSVHHNYVLVYRKSSAFELGTMERTEEHNINYSNPDNDPRGDWRTGDLRNSLYRPNLIYDLETQSGKKISPPENGWRYSRETMQEKIDKGEVVFLDDETRVIRKIYLADVSGRTPETIWFGKNVGTTRQANQELKVLFDGNAPFDTPKPVDLVLRMLDIATYPEDEDCIVMDFFAGSSTTAHAILEQNRKDEGSRKFIMIQFPEPTDNDEYPTIADIGKERIRRVIQRMINDEAGKLVGFEQHPDEDLGFRVFKLDSSAMRQWEEMPASTTTPEEYARQLEMFVKEPLLEGWTIDDVIAEVAIKETGFSLSYRVEQVAKVTELTVYRVIDDEKEQFFYICLDDKLSLDALKPLNLQREDLLIFRDSAVSDTIVANLVLTCRIKSI